MSDCNDGTLASAPSECKGALIVPEEESQCGSKCNSGLNLRSKAIEKKNKWWTLFTRQALEC